MSAPERSVLHVLPHPGGGGDTYVDVLDDMPGYRFGRVYLSATAAPAPGAVARRLAWVLRHAREYDVLHVHGEVAGALLLPLLAIRPSVVTLHGLHLARRSDGLGKRAAVLSLRAVVGASSRTICVSGAEHDVLSALLGAAAAGRAVVIHNGVHIPPVAATSARADVREELGIPREEVVGVWVGSLDERRDPALAVRAANAAGVALLVVGDGVLRPQVEQDAGPKVHVLGHRRDIARLFDAADFFVLVSAREGFAFGLLEAMAHGLPAVVTDLPENVEAIGDSGVAVPWGDETALSTALSGLAENEHERADFGGRARRRVVELFNADRMVERTRTVYEEALVERARRDGMSHTSD